MTGQLYKKFAGYYDKIYAFKDYKEEIRFIKYAISEYKTSNDNKLLDIACGTGNHAYYLKDDFSILGIDVNEEMLKIAREKVENVEFIVGDMKKLDIEQKFDIIICMFSAINYNTTYMELEATLRNFYNHLDKGGIVIFDLGFNKENWSEGMVRVDTVVEENLKIARISQSRLEDGIFNANFVFLVKENGKSDFDIDQHKLGVFEIEKVAKIMENVGFETFIHANYTEDLWESGLSKNPVFVGLK